MGENAWDVGMTRTRPKQWQGSHWPSIARRGSEKKGLSTHLTNEGTSDPQSESTSSYRSQLDYGTLSPR